MVQRLTTVFWVMALTGALTACGGKDKDAEDAAGDGDSSALDDDPIETCEDAEGPCVDHWGANLCRVDTGWPGDELAMCEREEGDGFILHYGPDDYDDPAQIEKYTLAGGGEEENCIYVKTPNTEDLYVDQFHARMRPGSHHLIVTVVDNPDPDLELNEPFICNQADANGMRWVLGSQDPRIDVAAAGGPGISPAAEGDPDFGAATMIPANSVLRIDMHYLNTSDAEILREAWISVNSVPKEEVKVNVDMITFIQAGIDVPPMSTGYTTGIARCTAPTDRYIGLITGHFHENGTRFSIWHEPADGEQVKIYETFNWEDPGNASYTDRHENPAMDDPAGDWGAESGYVLIKAGEVVTFQCEFDNPGDTAVGLGDAGKDQMCNAFGYYYPSDGDVWNCNCLGSFCF